MIILKKTLDALTSAETACILASNNEIKIRDNFKIIIKKASYISEPNLYMYHKSCLICL